MGLVCTILNRGTFGNRKMIVASVAHDDSGTTIDASDLEMHYIESIQFSVDNYQSAPSTNIGLANSNTYATFSEALKVGSDVIVTAIGW